MPPAPTVAVLAPSMFVTITIENAGADDRDEIHLHAGGQAIWISRMLARLGERPVVCTPLGGETGRALEGLAHEWHIQLDAVRVEAATPAYVHDRRDGERAEVARSAVPELGRHEADDLYGRMLEQAMAAGVAVLTGRLEEDVPIDFYVRLAADLAAAGVEVVGDLHGPELDACLEGGRLAWLKVSTKDLVEDGMLDDDTEAGWLAVGDRLRSRGVDRVVISRGSEPALACAGNQHLRIDGPSLEVVDQAGTGDSMTAALAAGVRRGLGTDDTLRLAWAAGAANVIRHGLGSASTDLVDALAERATITDVVSP